MKNFLNKEIRLCLSPVNYMFLAFMFMLIIPNYPCYVPFFYICLGSFFIFNNGVINKDIQYSMILPIKKSDIVKSRCFLVLFYELAALIVSIPFAILSQKLLQLSQESVDPVPNLANSGNLAGIDANVAFYGFVLIAMTVFHFIFFAKFYKKAEKPGIPFLLASIGYGLCYQLFEFPVYFKDKLGIEYIKILDSTDSSALVKQLPVLGAGILIYVLGWILTFKVSSKRFDKVDL